jgi:hypothetical protein
MRIPFRRMKGVGRREREVLNAVVALHREFGNGTQFTRAAIEHVLGEPCAGSLAGLTMLGFVTQRQAPEGIVYRATQNGHELAGTRERASIRINGHGPS